MSEKLKEKSEEWLEQYLAGEKPLHPGRLQLPSEEELDAAEAAFDAAVSRRKDHKRRYVLAFAAFALLGVGMVIAGANAPREKVLQCCVSGPISLESVAARYDIRRVDGKLLVLVER